MNVHFKDPGDETYNETLKKKLAEGSVSTRGLKENAKLFDEMVKDFFTNITIADLLKGHEQNS